MIYIVLLREGIKTRCGNFHTFTDPSPLKCGIKIKKINCPPKVQKKIGLKWLKTA